MKRRNPEHTIQSNISIPINGIYFDYVVKTTIFGEVLGVQNLFLKLPKAARELILTGDKKATLKKVKAYEKLIPYIVPFVVFEHIKVEGYEELVAAFQERREALEAKAGSLEPSFEEGSWRNELYKCKEITNNLSSLGEVLFKLNAEEEKLIIAIKQLRATPNHHLKGLILPLLISFVKNAYQRSEIYHILALYPSPENRVFLLKRFRCKEERSYRSPIIKALAPYKDEEVYNLLLKFIKGKKLAMLSELDVILDALSSCMYPEVKELAWQTLVCYQKDKTYLHTRRHDDKSTIVLAINMLRERGVSEQTIVAQLVSMLDDSRKMQKWPLTLEALNAINQKDLLPPQEKLLWLAKVAKEKRITPDFNLNLARLFSKRYDEQLLTKLYQLSRLKNPNLPMLILKIFGALYWRKLGNAQDELIPYQSHKGLRKQFIKWMNTDDETLNLHAMMSLSLLHSIEADNSIIPYFIEKINTIETTKNISSYRRSRRLLNVMDIINRVLKNAPYHSAITPLYTKYLSDKDAQVRAKAIQGFMYESNFRNKKTVLQTAQDQAGIVERVLKKYKKALTQHT